ncbi:MAG: Na+/H+ antiporter NhaC family protein, partial [Kangiellaceae bacterium]|nr:Na+/H+ antiporter NhaC family protein [Kangiellaceae bacterium]
VTPLIFISASVISFTTGTSWGTFGILIPIGIPVAQAMGIPAELILAAILGGGVFGDHCSPISDTTIVASLAAGCDHLDHVKTQLPYALVAGGLTITLYALAAVTF